MGFAIYKLLLDSQPATNRRVCGRESFISISICFSQCECGMSELGNIAGRKNLAPPILWSLECQPARRSTTMNTTHILLRSIDIRPRRNQARCLGQRDFELLCSFRSEYECSSERTRRLVSRSNTNQPQRTSNLTRRSPRLRRCQRPKNTQKALQRQGRLVSRKHQTDKESGQRVSSPEQRQ